MEEQPSTSGGIQSLIPQELQEKIVVIASKSPRVTGISSSNHNHIKFINTDIH